MNEKDLETISYNFLIPESLKTNNFKIIVQLKLKDLEKPKEISKISINDFQKQCNFIYEVQLLKKVNELLNCITFFKTFSKRSSNLIRFENWDDEKEFDFIINYITRFYFLIPNIQEFYNFYNLKCEPNKLDEEIKNIIKKNFLNI